MALYLNGYKTGETKVKCYVVKCLNKLQVIVYESVIQFDVQKIIVQLEMSNSSS